MELSSSHSAGGPHVPGECPPDSSRKTPDVDLVAAGRPVAHIAAELDVSRQTAYRWVRRLRAEGTARLPDRSSRPKSTPTRTSPEREQAVLDTRRSLRFGPLRVAALTTDNRTRNSNHTR